MLCLLFAIILLLSTSAWAAEDSRDTYSYRKECPENGVYYENRIIADSNNFVRCQCTSYVAHKLNELWGSTNPRFTNQYYGFDRWGHAKNWFNRARSDQAEIGITGAQDNFVWDESKFNAVFPGDVAYWDAGEFGHVAFVKNATPGPKNQGVGCVTWSEYNGTESTRYEFSERTMCRKSDGTFPSGFPKYFLHIDKDRVYCQANPTVDTCATLMGRVATAGLSKYVGGLGGGSSSSFNLKLDFDILDPTNTNQEWQAGIHTLRTGQAVRLNLEFESKGGDVRNFMRAGKDRIEGDFYVRLDDGDWTKVHRAYVKADNLRDGKKTEYFIYTIPPGVRAVSFKTKIDAEDEAYEANEGDNWSRIETFQIDFSWLIPLINFILEDD